MSNQTNTPGWCNGSTSDSGSFGLGSSPSPGARWRYGQAAKTSPSQGEIKGSIPFSATTKLTLILRYQRFLLFKCKASTNRILLCGFFVRRKEKIR